MNDWLVGQGLLDIAAGDAIGFVAATSCDYFAPLAFPGEAEVGLAVERLGTSSISYRLGVFSLAAADPAAQGRFTHVLVSRGERRPVPIPQAWRTALALLT